MLYYETKNQNLGNNKTKTIKLMKKETTPTLYNRLQEAYVELSKINRDLFIYNPEFSQEKTFNMICTLFEISKTVKNIELILKERAKL
jgi:hypothetical protein